MKKIKHSKFKNTGMLFELLVRQVTSDIISGNESSATTILKQFFNKNSELFKEYVLYKTLSEEKFQTDNKCQMLIEAVLKAKKKLDGKKLRDEKYQLIKTLSENFDIESFFQTKVQNYKLLASIYKIFEYTELDNPGEITRSKITIIENMIDTGRDVLQESKAVISEESKEIRILTYKLLVEKFNTKYDELSPAQKNVLREYINNVSITNNLKYFIQSEATIIKEQLTSKLRQVKDKALRIKLSEIIHLLDEYQNIKSIDENHVTAILRYYDILKDLDRSK